MSNIKQTKDGLIEKSTGRKIESPLDTNDLDVDTAISIAKEVVALYKKHNLSLTQYMSVNGIAFDIFTL